ncbi:MAG: hypothetical protein ACI9YT_000735 [Halobacteriales archaeon]|jgi:hypothetical protein
MTDDPFFADDRDIELSSDGIRTASSVPQIDPETYEMGTESCVVYQCGDCGAVIGTGD